MCNRPTLLQCTARWLAALLLGGAPATFYGLKARGSKGATLDPTLISTVSRGDLEIAVVELGPAGGGGDAGVDAEVGGGAEGGAQQIGRAHV